MAELDPAIQPLSARIEILWMAASRAAMTKK
jgi:hypothetical protein